MTTPRRRAEDWKDTSGHPLPKEMFHQLADHLGYRPDAVMSIRMNPGEVTVTWADERIGGMPRSTRHLYSS